MNWFFSDRASKLEARHLIGGEHPARVFNVGRHEVTVYDDGEVTCRQPSGYQGDPRRSLPNLEIVDGQIRIAMEDLIDEILARISPEELAVSLWANDEVKERFMEALSERWTSDNVGDGDRRKFLDKVKEAIHSKALDRLADAEAKLEYEVAKSWSAYQEISRANDRLAHWEITDSDGNPFRLKDPTCYGEFSIGGAAWNEAREHWRHETRKRLGWEPADEPASIMEGNLA